MMTPYLPRYSELQEFIVELQAESVHIPDRRKEQLQQLADYIQSKEGDVRLNFICTHNSRRSHLAMIWAAVAADFFALPQVSTFSGGTEATAFNLRAVTALERAGFLVDKPEGDNPHYLVHYSETQPPLECWSKTYDDRSNPGSRFAAIMTCADADQNCPFIPDAELRLSLTYQDPKEADVLPDIVPQALIEDHKLWERLRPAEVQKYNDRLRQIGREMIYAFSLVSSKTKT